MNSKGSQTEADPKSQALQALEEFNQEEIARQQEKVSKEHEKGKKKRIWIIGQWVILIICVGIVLFQIPAIISSMRSDVKPLRQGADHTNALTDQCIKNLWQISRLIQEGKMPGDNIVCPASKKPYVVVKTEEDIIIRSPNPELYGFKDIRVSQKNPVPELIK
jgi:hypothetical protein